MSEPTQTLAHEPATTWAPVPLDAVLAGDYVEQAPAILARSDGRCLLYPGRVHALHAEPEALKTWLALRACAECLRDYRNVVYIDFEDSAPSVIGRLLALGADHGSIREAFAYIRPDEALTDAALADLDAALELRPTLVVIDGVTEAFSRQGLNPLDNSDIATWLDLLPRRIIRRTEAAVLSLDHVVKDRESRGRYAIGGQHKLAGVDVAYSMRVIEPLARGRDGLVSIKVEKDRPGRVREFANGGQVAILRATSRLDGGVRLSLEPPEDNADTEGRFRPSYLMEKVSRFLETETEPASSNAVDAALPYKADNVRKALKALVDDGYVKRTKTSRSHEHESVRPYRQDDDHVPASQPRPDHVRDALRDDHVPASPPIRDADADAVTDNADNNHRVPDPDADLELIQSEAA